MIQSVLFTKEECDNIISISDKISHNRTDGWYLNDNTVNYTDWSILPTDENQWIFNRLIEFYNKTGFQKIKENPPIIHLHKYSVGDGFKRHQDIISNRKFAVGIILNDEFEGGEYILELGGKEIEIEKKIGNTYIFSGDVWHQINPIKNGIRWACVMFIQFNHLKFEQKTII
jgi:hypothetical protein